MKTAFFTKLVILFLLLLSAPVYFAQNSAQPTPNQPEVMGDDDRLPFMQNDQTQSMPEPSSGGLLLKTLGAMMLIVGLIFGGAWGAKKLGFGNSNSKGSEDDLNLTVLHSVSLGSGRTISTVRFGERVLLVGSTAQAFTLLAEEKSGAPASLLQSRSVAEMLGEEIIPFEFEFNKAEARLNQAEEEQI